jgi:hypothetical protein
MGVLVVKTGNTDHDSIWNKAVSCTKHWVFTEIDGGVKHILMN